MKRLSFWALILINVALAFPMGAMASDEGLCKATASDVTAIYNILLGL